MCWRIAPLLDSIDNTHANAGRIHSEESPRTRQQLKRRRLTRRLARHHLLLALVNAGVILVALASAAPAALLRQLTIATAWIALGLLGFTLLIGPWQVLRRQANPVSSDLRRDCGIWSALIGALHVALGLALRLDEAGYDWNALIQSTLQLGSDCPVQPCSQLNALGLLALLAGMIALIIQLVLLATSNDRALRRLGVVRWKRLQRLSYPLCFLALCHATLWLTIRGYGWGALAVLGMIEALVVLGQCAGYWRRILDRPTN